MILRYELPKEAEQVISLTDNERIYYAVPVDIDDAGNFLEDSYFIVTNRRLFVVEKGSIKQEYDVSKCFDVKAEAKIGGGLLVILTVCQSTLFIIRRDIYRVMLTLPEESIFWHPAERKR